MAEKVTVRGGGTIDGAEFNNAATEATLLRLLDAMKGKKDGTHSNEAKLRELASKSLKSNTNLVDESSVAYIGANKTVSGMATAAKTAGSAINKLGDMGATLASGVFSMAVAAGSQFVSFFTDSLDAFRETSSVGAGFNNDLVMLRKTAAVAGMSLDDFTSMVSRNSKLLASIGGTTTKGAIAFAEVSGQIRNSEFGKNMQMAGVTTGQLDDYLSGYLETQQKLGKIEGRIGEKERKGAEAYIEEMDQITKVTGVSRQASQDALRAAMKDGKSLNLASKLTGQALLNFQTGLTLMNTTLDPSALKSLTNMMSGIIDPGDRFAKILAQASPGIMDFQRALGKGLLNPEQQVAGYKKQSAAIKQYLKGFSDEQIARDANLTQLKEYQASINKYETMDFDQAVKEQKAQNDITKAMATFGQTIQTIKSKIMLAMLESKVFEKLEKAMATISKKFDEYAPKIGDMLAGLIDGIDQAFSGNGSIWEGITNAFATLFDKLGPIVGDLFSSLFNGLTGGDKDKRKAELQSKKSALETKLKNNPGGFNSIDPKDVKALQDINEQLANIDSKPLEKVSTSLNTMFPILEPIGTVVKGLSWAFDNWGLILGGLVVGGGALAMLPMLLGGVGAGLSGVLGPVALVAAAIGLGAGGLGLMFLGVSKVIDAFVEGFKSIPVVIGDLIKLDAGKMKDVGVSLGLISGPMAELAKGGILATLGGSSGLGSVAESLKKFESINSETIAGLVKPLRDFKETLNLYVGGGILESFSSGIGSLFRGDSGLGKLAEGFKAFSGIDASGLEKLSKFDNNSLKDLGSALNVLADPLLKITASSGIMSLFGSNGLGAFADSFTKLNQIDGQNIRNVVGSIESIKTVVGSDFSAQASSVNTFTDSIKNLNKAITELNTALATIATSGRGILGGGPSNLEVVTRAIGGANTGGSAGSEKLNTLVTELISLTKEIKDYSKDQADALNGRRNPI